MGGNIYLPIVGGKHGKGRVEIQGQISFATILIISESYLEIPVQPATLCCKVLYKHLMEESKKLQIKLGKTKMEKEAGKFGGDDVTLGGVTELENVIYPLRLLADNGFARDGFFPKYFGVKSLK